jgi:NAD(P)H-dependent FMN reductase
MIIGCPEYNSLIFGVLKNTVDWVSRPREGEQPLECFDRKIIGLVAASPGGLGGIRGLPIERTLFGHIKAIVLPDQFSLAKAHEAFDDNGNLKDDTQRGMAEGVGKAVAEVAAAAGKVTA